MLHQLTSKVEALVPTKNGVSQKDKIPMNDIFPSDYPDFYSEGIAPCATSDPEAFFPQEYEDEDGKLNKPRYYNEEGARAVCAECPYKLQCLKFALDNHELGMWGGTTENQRRQIRRIMSANKKRSLEQIADSITR